MAVPDLDFDRRLVISDEGLPDVAKNTEIGRLSDRMQADLAKVWSLVDKQGRLRPAGRINNVHMIGVTTIALSDSQRTATRPPFRTSGFALAPVVKGFPLVQFLYRSGRR